VKVDVVLLPRDLTPGQLRGRACAVFDVLRATTTMAAALAAGVKQIRLFENLADARAAGAATAEKKLLCGEEACLPPAGFDLGNSPGQFVELHRGSTLFMCTTNGTRAMLAAREAELIVAAAVVNAAAVADMLRRSGLDITLLCAGTNGAVAMEDVIGAGALIAALGNDAELTGDAARLSRRAFEGGRDSLPKVFRDAQGGRNLLKVGLDADIDFAARISVVDAVGIASGEPLTVLRATDAAR
jgi:2-phosphosulfolactate phosphatase